MNKRNLLYMLMIIFSSHVSAQTCKEMFVKANSYYNAGKYEDAKSYYQQVIKCGDEFFIKDCKNKINLINDITYKAKKSAPFGLSRNEVIIPYQGGDAVVTVNGGSSWKISINSDWCTIKKSGSQIIISSKENTELNDRTAKIQVTSGTQFRTIVVTNEGAPEILRSSVENIMFPSEGETNTVDIFANTNWEIKDIPEWISANKETGKIELTALANNQNTARKANVRIESPSNSVIIINIFQGAGNEKLSFSKNELKFGPNGGDEYIKVYTDAEDWKFGDFPHWCQLTRISNDSIKIHCAPNAPINEIREASINVTTGLQTLGINVSQEARPMIAQVPDLGIGGRGLSFGITAGYLYPMIGASSGGNFTGSPVNYALGNNSEEVSYSSGSGFTIGAHADIRLYKNLYLIAGVSYLHYSYKNEFQSNLTRVIPQTSKVALVGNTQNKYSEEYTINTIEIPVLASYRLPINKISHVLLNFGPVVNYGLSAKMKLSGNTDSETMHKYKIDGHQVTNERYDGYNYSMHYTGNGELDLYGKNVSFYETYSEGNNADIKKDNSFEASPYKRLQFGARIGVTYEYSGISLGIEYNLMLTNLANKKFWEGDRWKVFDQTANTIMSGYKQRNNYLSVKLGYTFRY